MNINVTVNATIHMVGDTRESKEIHNEIHKLLEAVKLMAQSLDQITAAVANESTVIDSAVTLLQGLSAQITAAGVDPAALSALTDTINAKAASLAHAIIDNTPAAEAPAEKAAAKKRGGK